MRTRCSKECAGCEANPRFGGVIPGSRSSPPQNLGAEVVDSHRAHLLHGSGNQIGGTVRAPVMEHPGGDHASCGSCRRVIDAAGVGKLLGPAPLDCHASLIALCPSSQLGKILPSLAC